MTHSGQPRMNIRRCVPGAFLRDLSQAQQFFEGVESFGFVSLIAREDFGQNFGGALMGKLQGWNFRERQRSRRHVKGDCLEAQCRDWPYSVPARGEEADGGHCGRDGQIESRRTRDIDACRCGQVGQDHQTTWHHSPMTEIPEFAALLEEIVGSQHHRSFSEDWPFEELTRCSLLNRIAKPQNLIYSLICLHLMLAFKIVHRRGADRTPHCLALIKHREINDHPIEVVAQYFASLQRHCKSSVLKRSGYAISAGLAQPAIAASKISEFFEVTQHPTAEWLARQITILDLAAGGVDHELGALGGVAGGVCGGVASENSIRWTRGVPVRLRQEFKRCYDSLILRSRSVPTFLVLLLAIKPNQPEDDGEYGVPDVTLPNVALPIARGQHGCLTKNPRSARPLIRGHEREANGTNQDKRGDHRQTFPARDQCPNPVHSTTGRKFELMHYPKISNIVICDRGHHGKESAKLFALHQGAAAEYGSAASPKHGLHTRPQNNSSDHPGII